MNPPHSRPWTVAAGPAYGAVMHTDPALNAIDQREAQERGQRMRSAAKWIGVLAILFAVSGALMFVLQQMQTEQALKNLAPFADSDVMQPIEGETYTAGQLREMVKREPYQVLVVNLVIAAIMGGLWYWGRRAPLPAIATAIALFIVVHVVSGIIDPSSIPKGILIKVIALVILGKGLKAALEARAAMQRPAAG